MTKIRKNFRLDENLVKALTLLSGSNSETQVIERLILKEAMKKLEFDELENIFGDDYERMTFLSTKKYEIN